MAIVFLSGGTGNHLFQHSRAEPSDTFSYFFLDSQVRRVLGWADHERLFEFPRAGWFKTVLALLLLPGDIILAKLTGRSLFSRLDLRSVKAEPLISRLIQFGYFQSYPASRKSAELTAQIDGWTATQNGKSKVAIHIRGGNILALERSGKNKYGLLTPDYFRDALLSIPDLLSVSVFTDDPGYSQTLINDVGLSQVEFTIDGGSLDDMIAACATADVFIACNSTLSYWILLLRGAERTSYAPVPFTKELNIELPDHVERVSVDF